MIRAYAGSAARPQELVELVEDGPLLATAAAFHALPCFLKNVSPSWRFPPRLLRIALQEATAALPDRRLRIIHPIATEGIAMKKLPIIAALAAGLLLQSGAFAGVNSAQTTVAGSSYGYGAFHDARFNSGSTEAVSCYIGAYVTTYTSTVTSNYISCSATNTAGQNYYCYVYNPPATWVTMVSGMNESSWIYFYGDSAHHCLGIIRRTARSTWCRPSTAAT
jgi:hypothetical protein